MKEATPQVSVSGQHCVRQQRRVDVSAGRRSRGWSLGARAQDRDVPAGEGFTSKSQAQLRFYAGPCTERGVSWASSRLQQWVGVNGPFIPGGSDRCAVLCGAWIERFTSVAHVGEVQQPRPGYARRMP